MQKQNQFIVGAGYDYSRMKFKQSSEMGLINTTRGVDGIDVYNEEADVNLRGKTYSYGLFATDTLSLNEFWHATLSGRYNYIKVENTDKLIPDSSDPASFN